MPTDASLGTKQDVLIAGAGLAATLTAFRLKSARPDIRITMVEARSAPDEEHTWCCFKTDLDGAQAEWLWPIMTNHWSGYEVRFPSQKRKLSTQYARLSAASLNQFRDAVLPGVTQYGTGVKSLADNHLVLTDGRILSAPLVLDARGAPSTPELEIAFQKFVGLEVELNVPHGLASPIVMDAQVAQIDGYRFIYVLPLGPNRLLIEDTRYSDGSDLDVEQLLAAIRDYARSQNWIIANEGRVETGVLPILLSGDFDKYQSAHPHGIPIGMRGLMFHPTTGYSLPQAAAMADLVAHQPILTTEAIRPVYKREAKAHWHNGSYLRLLNRMMFHAAAPDQRYKILQAFYRHPQALIERFYANRLTVGDRLRIVSGRPPVPLLSAARAAIHRGPVYG